MVAFRIAEVSVVQVAALVILFLTFRNKVGAGTLRTRAPVLNAFKEGALVSLACADVSLWAWFLSGIFTAEPSEIAFDAWRGVVSLTLLLVLNILCLQITPGFPLLQTVVGISILLQVPLSAGAVVWYVKAGVEALWAMPTVMHICILLLALVGVTGHLRVVDEPFRLRNVPVYQQLTIARSALIVCASVGLTIWSCCGPASGQYVAHGVLVLLQVGCLLTRFGGKSAPAGVSASCDDLLPRRQCSHFDAAPHSPNGNTRQTADV